MLLTCILLFYFGIMISPDYGQRWLRDGVMIGALGALSYFAKAFGFYFFVAHFLLANIAIFCNSDNVQKNKTIKVWSTGMLIFLVISSLWVFALHSKYGKYMLLWSILNMTLLSYILIYAIYDLRNMAWGTR